MERQGLPKYIISLVIGIVWAGTVSAAQHQAKQKPNIENRLALLERLLDNQGLVEMLVRLESLQSELQRLRGEIEVNNHTLDQIKKRQRDLYIDIDRRLLQLERKSAPSVSQISPSPDIVSPSPSSSMPVSPPITAPVTQQVSPPTVATTTTAHTTVRHNAAHEQQSYQKAFDLLREMRYDAASSAFRKFLYDYPSGRYAHIAQYWLGEANYTQQKFDAAIIDYQNLIDNYPSSPKLAEALLKIGHSHFALKQYSNARSNVEQLIKRYPGTTEAGQGQNLLQKIKIKQRAP